MSHAPDPMGLKCRTFVNSGEGYELSIHSAAVKKWGTTMGSRLVRYCSHAAGTAEVVSIYTAPG